MTKTEKVEHIARVEGQTVRNCWKRLKAGDLDLDAYEYPPAPITEPATVPAVNPAELLLTIQHQAEQLGELRERFKWVAAERDHLQREIGLLKAPPEPAPAPAPAPRGPSLAERLRLAWQLIARGELKQQPEG